MFRAKNGLGDAEYKEVAELASAFEILKVGEEMSFTEDSFESEQLYDTVINAFGIIGAVTTLRCGVNRWFETTDGRIYKADCRIDVVVVRRIR